MLTVVGRDFFPAIDGGQIKLHVRAPAGTRIEATERIFQEVEDKIREVIPARDRDLIVDDIGVPQRAVQSRFHRRLDHQRQRRRDPGVAQGGARADRRLRAPAPRGAAGRLSVGDLLFPGRRHDHPDPQFRTCRRRSTFASSVAIARHNLRVAQGAAAPHRGHSGHRRRPSSAGARCAGLHGEHRPVAGAQLGLNAQTIANDVNTSLSSSEQVTPNFWTDPANGIPYYIAVQTPEHLVSSLGELGNTPVSTQIASNGPPIPGLLEQRGDASARKRSDQSEPEQHPAGLRHLRQRAGPRSRRHFGRHRQDRRRTAEGAQARQHDPGSRPDPEHARFLPGSGHRPAVRGRVRLSAHGRQLPEFRRSRSS